MKAYIDGLGHTTCIEDWGIGESPAFNIEWALTSAALERTAGNQS